jgi:hypothetical protein
VTAIELLQALRSAGAGVAVVGSDLKIRAPKGAVTPELREAIVAHKSELVKMLSTYPCASCGRFAFKEPGKVCFWCIRRRDGTAA